MRVLDSPVPSTSALRLDGNIMDAAPSREGHALTQCWGVGGGLAGRRSR